MTEKHSLPRRTHLLSGMPQFRGFPRRPLRSGTGPSVRNPGQTCRFAERIALTEAELSEIAAKINAAGRAGQAVAHTDPVLCVTGAPTLGALHELLNQVADDAAADPPGRRDPHQDDADLFPPAGSAVIDLGRAPWPAAR